MTSIRQAYQDQGVDAFYREEGRTYRNPHEPAVGRLLRRVCKEWPLDLSHVLDLAAGSGEATLVLREMGAQRIDGIDPYTFDAYADRTGLVAQRQTFEQIAAGALSSRRYSLIVCSFAMHLVEPSRLPSLAYELSQIAPALLILTPHKRPELRAQWGWTRSQMIVMDRVRAVLYLKGKGFE